MSLINALHNNSVRKTAVWISSTKEKPKSLTRAEQILLALQYYKNKKTKTT